MRVAVIGCGSIGRRHIGNLRGLGCDVTAMDPSEAARERLKAEHPFVPAYGLLGGEETFDAMVIASPARTHKHWLDEARRRRVPCCVEKPIGVSRQEFEGWSWPEEIPSLVGCNMRFHSGPRILREHILSELGPVQYARLITGSDIRGWPGLGYESALLECGGHELDLARALFGAAKVIGAFAVRDGLWDLQLVQERAALVHVHLNYVQFAYERSITVIGNHGQATWTWAGGDRQSLWWRSGDSGGVLVDPDTRVNPNEMYVDELAHFLECARNGQPTCCPIPEGLAALELVEEARAIARRAA